MHQYEIPNIPIVSTLIYLISVVANQKLQLYNIGNIGKTFTYTNIFILVSMSCTDVLIHVLVHH